MTCGCPTNLVSTASMAHQECAAMCAVCPASEQGRRFCQDGVPVHFHIFGHECPLGHFPDANGKLEWLGLTWYGVPYPVRLWLRAFHRKHCQPGWWRWCGCIAPLKDLWTKVQSRLKGSLHVEHPVRPNQSHPHAHSPAGGRSVVAA